MSISIILVHPEIPPNTGNVIRLAANTGASLHLVEPLGFSINDKQLRRAGLDYHDTANMHIHPSLSAALTACGKGRCFAISAQGQMRYDQIRYQCDDILIFGKESTGLPEDILHTIPTTQQLFIPMRPDNRSLNLSNAVAVLVMEAWRQLGFAGAYR